MNTSPDVDALGSLRECRAALLTARQWAESAQTHLAGVRQGRAAELAEKLADDIAFVDRLSFLVEGDARG
jgi:hypothetical protein